MTIMNKKDLREKVLEFLKSTHKNDSEKYNEGFQLYRESELKDFNQERVYNQGFTDNNLRNLMYDLQKINGISDLEIANAKMQVVKEVEEIETTAETVGDKSNVIADLKKEGRDLKKQVTNELTAASTSDDEKQTNSEEETDNKELLEEAESTDESSASTQEKTQEVSGDGTGEPQPDFVPAPTSEERIKLRDDFPFLNDANCPDELKVLMADKITAYNEYVAAQNTLVKHSNGEVTLTDDELKEVTKSAVENFELNKEIYEELNYFKDNGKILGNHPIFKNLTLQREVDAMSIEECFKYLNSSKKFISVKTTALEELVSKKPKGYKAKMTELTQAIEARKAKVSLVKQKQGISE